MGNLDKTHVFERGDHVYLVGPISPIEFSDEELAALEFGAALRDTAPNENIMWLHGPFAEADTPNENGALWTADELAIKSLTPRFMPVTVMHDPSTAVGLIADAKMRLRSDDPALGRSRIDTTLGLWRHRFPDVCEEAMQNYRQGALMQSLECLPAYYDCVVCERRYPKLPGGLEKANWCEHLRGETAAANGKPTRRLGNVTFTGTGLIFGTRGARGALDTAHLEVLEEEVAEFHERAHDTSPRRKRPRRPKGTMEIEDQRYQELVAKASKVDDLEARLRTADETAARVPDLESKIEETEAAKTKAEGERDAAQSKVTEAEETARKQTLSSDRLGKLGKGFTGKLGDFTRGRLEEQAGALSDEEWEARVKELEETAGVQRDAKGEGEGDGEGAAAPAGGAAAGTFSREETARSGAGGAPAGNGNGQEPSPEARRSVVAGLAKPASSGS